jgi:hypothetical protein
VEIELILDAAHVEAPELRETARRIFAAEADRLGVLLDSADVLLRWAEGVPAVHVTAAADGLLEHLATTHADPRQGWPAPGPCPHRRAGVMNGTEADESH